MIACVLAACGDDEAASSSPDAAVQVDAAVDAAPVLDASPVTDRCTTTVSGSGSFVELCGIPGGRTVQHVRIAGLKAPATHASAQIVFGFAAPPGTAQDALAADQVRVLFYGGGPAGPMTLAPIVQVSFGATTETLAGDTSFVPDGGDVCFDLHDGTATAAPAFAMWVTGQKGADCAASATLTADSAFALRALWHGAAGTVDKQAKIYFRQADGITATPAITLRDAAALTDAQITAAVQCSTSFAAGTDWQPLCTNAGGAARHVRMTGAASTTANHFFYTIIGQDPNPTGSPQQGAGKLIVTGGMSNSGTSWTYFRFNNGTTGQFSYATDAGAALYTGGPSTVCYDLGANGDGNARVVFWATGAHGADCAQRSTLALANALYDSGTDATTGAIWNAPLVTGKLDFVKASNTGATMQSVEVASEPAVLE